MKKTTKIWLISAALFVLIGCIIFGVVMSMLKWDFSKLSTGKYETNHYVIEEQFKNISIETDTADLIFISSADGQCRVECFEETKAKHSVSVENEELVIRVVNKKAWYDFIGFFFHSPKVTVYLPDDAYASLFIDADTGDVTIPGDFRFSNIGISLSTGNVECLASVSGFLKIKSSTGDIHVSKVSADTLNLSATTGNITVSNVLCEEDVLLEVSTGKTVLTEVKCKNLVSNGSTGNLVLQNVMAAGAFTLERSTGSIRFEGSDAAEIYAKTDTGNITGTLLSDKVFIATSDTGKVDVPKTVSSGKCEFTTDTGNIVIRVR